MHQLYTIVLHLLTILRNTQYRGVRVLEEYYLTFQMQAHGILVSRGLLLNTFDTNVV